MRYNERIAMRVACRVKDLIERELPGQVEIEKNREWNKSEDERWLTLQFLLIFHPMSRIGNRFASVYYNSSNEAIYFTIYSCGYPGRNPDHMSMIQRRAIGMGHVYFREYPANNVTENDIKIFIGTLLNDPSAHADNHVSTLPSKEKTIPENMIYCRRCDRVIAIYAQNCPHCGDSRIDIEYVATHYRNLRRQQE